MKHIIYYFVPKSNCLPLVPVIIYLPPFCCSGVKQWCVVWNAVYHMYTAYNRAIEHKRGTSMADRAFVFSPVSHRLGNKSGMVEPTL